MQYLLTANQWSTTISDWQGVDVLVRSSNADLSIMDEANNTLALFENGHIRTKNFNSSSTNAKLETIEEYADKSDVKNVDSRFDDFNIKDENNNVLVQFSNGHIKTKNFDSSKYIDNQFKNKTVSFLGDSITTFNGLSGSTNSKYPTSDVVTIDDTWWGKLLNLMSATFCNLNAQGGSCITHGYYMTSGYEDSFLERYNLLFSNGGTGNAPNYIFVMGGINDWNANAPLGDYTDSWNIDGFPLNFIPSFRKLLYVLQTTYPSTEIVVVTPARAFYGVGAGPYYPPTKNNKSINDYVDAIKKCCSYHGVPCIDIYNTINLNGENQSSLLIDTIHPKELMMKKIADIIFNNIKLLY